VRNIPTWHEYLGYGNMFIVVTENEVYCKIETKNDDKEISTLKSYNLNYNEFEMPKKIIILVYKVIETISLKSY
jgi:hypothetical protein